MGTRIEAGRRVKEAAGELRAWASRCFGGDCNGNSWWPEYWAMMAKEEPRMNLSVVA